MNQRRIVLLGFMACGKTTVGRELARQLECGFVDLDSFITERGGRSPAELIMKDGEASFREGETLALRDVLQDRAARVIALGGGTWLSPANRTLVALHDCLSVWLDVPFEVCWRRIAGGKSSRPMASDYDTAKRRFDDRWRDYALAERTITIGPDDTVQTIVDEILRQT